MWSDVRFIAAIPFASAVVAAVLCGYLWPKRRNPIGRWVLCLIAACGVWSFFYGLELIVPQLQAKVFAAQFQYVGIVFVAPSWCFAAVYASGLGRYLSGKRLAALSAIPVLTLIAAFTNSYHGMLWRDIWISTDGLPFLRFHYGWVFWLNNQYAWALLLCGTILLLRNAFAGQSLYRGQRVFMVLTILVPWVANAAYVLDAGPISGLDLTPFAFVVSALFLVLSVVRYRLSEVVPVAREFVLEHIDDCMFVLDMDGKVIDVNHAGLAILGADARSVVGYPANAVFAQVPALKRLTVCSDGITARFRQAVGDVPAMYAAHVTSVKTNYGMPLCRIITCWNITSEIAAAASLREREARYKDLFEESPIALWQEDFSEVRQFVERLRASGVTDIERHFVGRPEAVVECARLVKVLDVNRAALVQHGASDKKELLDSLPALFTEQTLLVFRDEVVALSEGKTVFSAESERKSLTGKVFWVAVNVRVLPGHEDTLGCVLVSNIDITKRKVAEDDLMRLGLQVRGLRGGKQTEN
ncbi:MAG: PAS domain-containing protein [Candidatus Hydrogenedentes bacterium]|nr:PAS domain-containing protein [Candidatus Hydrogenedentota bacterium]